jgi:hypothetical protein
MNIIKNGKEKYMLVNIEGKKHRLVKILKESDYGKDNVAALTDLMMGDITEKDLLKEYLGDSYMEDVESGKQGNRINVLEAGLECIRAELLQVIGNTESLDRAARNVVKRINELIGE